MKIRSDIPKEIISLIKMIDWNKITELQLQKWADMLKTMALQYGITKRAIQSSDKFINVDIPNCPQKVGNFISEFDFSNIPKFKINLAYGYAKANLGRFVPLK